MFLIRVNAVYSNLLEGDNDIAMSQMSHLSGETSSILRFGIEMACREGISDPNGARLAVAKTEDISCDGASQLLSRLKNCCHHVSAVSLVQIAVTVRHICCGGGVLH